LLSTRAFDCSPLEKPDAVFVDAGRGEGVIDRLRSLGFTVIEVNFGGQAHE
jgi:hypothetical protein